MPDIGEIGASVLLVFVTIFVFFALQAAFSGGDVGAVTDQFSTLIGPIVFVVILIVIAGTMLNLTSGR